MLGELALLERLPIARRDMRLGGFLGAVRFLLCGGLSRLLVFYWFLSFFLRFCSVIFLVFELSFLFCLFRFFSLLCCVCLYCFRCRLTYYYFFTHIGHWYQLMLFFPWNYYQLQRKKYLPVFLFFIWIINFSHPSNSGAFYRHTSVSQRALKGKQFKNKGKTLKDTSLDTRGSGVLGKFWEEIAKEGMKDRWWWWNEEGIDAGDR